MRTQANETRVRANILFLIFYVVFFFLAFRLGIFLVLLCLAPPRARPTHRSNNSPENTKPMCAHVDANIKIISCNFIVWHITEMPKDMTNETNETISTKNIFVRSMRNLRGTSVHRHLSNALENQNKNTAENDIQVFKTQNKTRI